MHKKYGDKVACMSVSVADKKALREQEKDTLDFLKKQQATFANFLLDEDESLWQNKLGVDGPPAVIVFDRENRRARKFVVDPDDLYTYRDVEALVKQLLNQEPGPMGPEPKQRRKP